MPSDNELREHVRKVLLARLSQDGERRGEALREFLAVTIPDMNQEAADRVVALVPPLMDRLYEKWIGMFTDRLFETVPRNQIEHLCDGTTANDASLSLVYIMYLESETMEKQIEKDLAEYGREQSGADDLGDVAADYLRAVMTRMAGQAAAQEKG
jgi:hypothetical protein